MTGENILMTLRQDAVEIAKNILQEKIGVLEGVRLLFPVLWKIEAETGIVETEFSIFRGIESEAEEEFPDPATKENWNVDAWKKQNEGLAQYEASIKELVQSTCRRLLEIYRLPLQ